MKKFLAGIKSVEFGISEFMTINANEKLAHGIPVQVAGTFTSICIEGLASATYETKRLSGQDVYTSVLSFRAGDQQVIPWNLEAFLSNRNLIYRLTDINGKQWLMGINEKPFPVSTVKKNNPADPAGTNISDVEITYNNLFPFLEIK